MGKLPETLKAVLMEKQNWENIINSPDWVAFRGLLNQHIEFLQKEINEHLRKHEDRQACEALRAMDDAKKILELVRARISDLNQRAEKGED